MCVCLLIPVVNIICCGSSWLLWATLGMLPIHLNFQTFVLGMLGGNTDFIAQVKMRAFDWMELPPPSILVLANLIIKVQNLFLSPVPFHSHYKTMSSISRSLQSKFTYLLTTLTQRSSQELEQGSKQHTNRAQQSNTSTYIILRRSQVLCSELFIN